MKYWKLTRALKEAQKEQEQYEHGEVLPLHLITTAEVLKLWYDSQEDA